MYNIIVGELFSKNIRNLKTVGTKVSPTEDNVRLV